MESLTTRKKENLSIKDQEKNHEKQGQQPGGDSEADGWKVTDCWCRPTSQRGSQEERELAGEDTISSQTNVKLNRPALALLTSASLN